MFAGIGPFAIPAAQKGCMVYANDLNPDSVKYIKIDAQLNKLDDLVHTFNLDAGKFISQMMSLPESKTSLQSDVLIEECEINREPLKQEAESDGTPVPDDNASYGDGLKGLCAGAVTAAPAAKRPLDTSKEDVFRGLIDSKYWKGPSPWIHCYCFMKASETKESILAAMYCLSFRLLEACFKEDSLNSSQPAEGKS